MKNKNLDMVAQHLIDGLSEMRLNLSTAKQQLLLDYMYLLKKWNQTYNLTAITDEMQMVTYHLLDSLTITAYIKGSSILDVGTGGGVPGIPLAIFYPEKQFTLLDSNGKKTRFLRHVAHQLGLSNVSVVHSRMEEFATPVSFDTITARAVKSIDSLLQWTPSLLVDNGCWVLMKGVNPHEELQNVTLPYQVVKLKVPGLDAKRHVVLINNI